MDSLMVATLPPFLAYCLVQGITPGPANLCSLSATMRHGTAAALRQWAGLLIGFIIVALASVGIVWGALEWFARVLPALSILGALYVSWLAWKTIRPDHDGDGGTERKPTVLSGIFIQLTNVKIVLMCLTALIAYVVPHTREVGTLLLFGLLMPLTGLSCNMAWIMAGSRLRAWYERHRRGADAVLATMLLACALGMVAPLFQR